MKLTLSLLSSLLLFIMPLAAQVDNGRPAHFCGVTESHPWMDAYLNNEIATPRSMMPIVLPLRFIIVGTSDGTGYADVNDIMGSVCRMNDDFAASNISFFIEGEMDTINNSSYWDHTFNSGALMMAFNNQSGVINVYVVGSPAGNCGYYLSTQDALAIDKDCMGYDDPTLSHEVGHFFTLRHTFFGWEGEGDEVGFAYLPTEDPAPNAINSRQVEKVDSSNCNTAADGFCDTPPDYISVRWPCNGSGYYPDSLIDPNGDKFVSYGANIMSYSNDACVDSFSTEQINAMNINANSRSSLHSGETPNNNVVPQVVQISPANGEVLEVFDYAVLTWEAATDADFYIVEVNNTQFFNGAIFRRYVVYGTTLTITEDLATNRNYYWRVRGVNKFSPCTGDYSGIRRFRNGTISGTVDPALDAAVFIYPNPVSTGQEQLFIQGTDLPTSGELNYELMNMTGQIIRREDAGIVPASGFQKTLDLNGMPQGIYFLRIRLNDRLLTRRIVLN